MHGNYRTGPQRAEARAHLHGLTVGELVRITHPNYGFSVPFAAENRPRPMAKPRPLVPLDFAQRLERYAGQACAVAGGVVGKRWRPTAAQRRRMRHKANHAAAPFGRDYTAEARLRQHEVVTSLETGEQRTVPLAKPVSPEQFMPRGFRVVDRRGEHRA